MTADIYNKSEIYDYLYAFVKNNISAVQFERWIIPRIDWLKRTLGKNLTERIVNFDYADGDLSEIKSFIEYELGGLSEKDDLYDCGNELQRLMDWHSQGIDVILLDCSDICDGQTLQNKLRFSFGFPPWYGKNWDAFNDLVSLTEVDEIRLIGFDQMKKHIPQDAENLINLLERYKDKCDIIKK